METILRKELLQKKLMKLKICNYTHSTSYRLSPRKVHHRRFENLVIFSCLFNTLKISHSYSTELTSYLPVQFKLFLGSSLLLNIFYCFEHILTFHSLKMYISQKRKPAITWNLKHMWRQTCGQIFESALVYL